MTLDEALLGGAKLFRVNISQAAEVGLTSAVVERALDQLLEERHDVLDNSSAYMQQHGLPLAQFRNF